MKLNELVQPGNHIEFQFVVEEQHTASQIGSGSLRVLATPAMVLMMEKISHRLLAEKLPEGYSSVGVHLDVRHLAPSPIGSTVTVRSEVIQVDERSVIFKVSAWDTVENIGEGTHTRMAIDVERFLKRVAGKQSQIDPGI